MTQRPIERGWRGDWHRELNRQAFRLLIPDEDVAIPEKKTVGVKYFQMEAAMAG